jgi:putative pyoverdin transport system ATP-binding/permease protein
MNLIWFLVRNSWITLVIGTVMGSVSGACSTLLLARINDGINNSSSSTPFLLWNFVGLVIVSILTSVLSQYLLVKLSQAAVYQLRLRLSESILTCPLSHLEKLGANRLLATLTEDISTISHTVLIIPFLCINLALIIGCLIYLIWLSFSVFLLAITIIILGIVIVQFFLSKAYSLFQSAREEEDRLFKHFHTITDGIKELKLNRNRREAFLTEDLRVSAAASSEANISSMTILAISEGNSQLLFFTILGLLVFALPEFITIKTGILSSYVVTITYLMQPFDSTLKMLPGISQASVALQKIDTLGLSLASNLETFAESNYKSLAFKQSLELKEVTHTYNQEDEENSFTLGPINLFLHPGELVFLIGGNGSGKSTLGKLITGLYLPEQGEILVDGCVVSNQNRENYRQLFVAIFSDFYLFEKLLGINNNDIDVQTKKYLKKLQLQNKVNINNGVFSTIELSQGQRKRLALLTAYLEDRPIYIFDEWAAEQDPYFREIFYQQLLPELKSRGKTILVITHDDRYFQLADRLIKLDYGKIVNDLTAKDERKTGSYQVKD